MRALAAVFAREVFARRLVFPVALAAGFVPIVGSLAYGWSKPDAAEGRILVALVAAAAFSMAFALLFGGSVIAGETSEKRISFFFARPLTAGAIWGGKLLAVLVLTLVPGVLALVPAVLSATSAKTRSLFGLEANPWQAALATVAAALFFILGAHAVVTIARLRSPWVALDVLLAPALVLLAAAFLRSLVRNGLIPSVFFSTTFDLIPRLVGLAAFVLLAALAAASYTQVVVGRTDARRAHGAFSVVLWGILGTATAALGGYAWWVASAQATDLATLGGGVMVAPRGPWVALGGPLRAGRGAGFFLFDTTGNRSQRIRSGDAVFSATGTRAAWTEERFGFFERERKSDLLVADLASAKAAETGLTCSVWCRVALSPSGTRLAVLDQGTLAAYEITDISNPKQLAAIRTEAASKSFAFVDDETVRLFPRVFNSANRKDIAPRGLEIEEIFLPSKASSFTGRFERETLPFLRLSADGRYLVGTREKILTFHDVRTGALLATLSSDLESPKIRFLSGDRMVVAGVSNGKGLLKIFLEGSRAPALPVELGPAASVILGSEVAPGRIAVSLNPFRSNDDRSRRAWKLAFVDVTTGAVSAGPDGLVPSDRFSWWFSPVLSPAEVGLPSSTLFLDTEQRLVRLDPETGAQTVLLGGSK